MTQSTAEAILTVQGAEIPKLGFGTWELNGADAVEAVRDALEIGYRHIDTARGYENEREVGRAIADSGLDRERIFLTTKLSPSGLRADRVREQAEASLRALGTDYVDLLLIHWPNPDVPIAETLEAMAELRERGKAGSLGVSNFPTAEINEALDAAPAPLVVDQVEYHPYLDQSALLGLAGERDFALTAYSPLARGELIGDETLERIGAEHGKSAAQVALRWLIEQERVVAVPRSSSHGNRQANFEVFDFELSDRERSLIAELSGDGRLLDPPWAPDWD